MNLTPNVLEDRLRQVAKQIKIQRFMIDAHIENLKTQQIYHSSANITALALEQFSDARFHDKESDKLLEAIESLTKIEYKMIMDQRSIGLSIQRLISYQGRMRKYPEPNKFYEALEYGKLKDKVLIQLTSTYEYKFRNYEFGGKF